MPAYRNGPSKTYLVRVYGSDGVGHRTSTGVRVKADADAIADAVDAIRTLPAPYPAILDAVVRDELALAEVRDGYADRKRVGTAWVYPGLDALVERLHDVDVIPLLSRFQTALAGREGAANATSATSEAAATGDAVRRRRPRKRKVSKDTAQHYVSAVRTVRDVLAEDDALDLVSAGAHARSTTAARFLRVRDAAREGKLLRSALDPAVLQAVFDAMEEAPATVLKRGRGLSRFCDWLVTGGLLRENPIPHVELPPPGDPRAHYVETNEAMLLADAHAGIYRPFSALLAGTGIEVSVALNLRRRDVSAKEKEIRAAGTKNYNRDRVAVVAEWAWPYLEETLSGRHPDSRLFESIPDRWIALDHHIVARDALIKKGHLVFQGYTMRDQRHTWAVRAVRSGWPIELVARQLGHKDGVLALRVYGRFKPSAADRAHWEALAAARDVEMAAQAMQEHQRAARAN